MRDERKRLLKLSLAKLRQIDDAESCLCRSVLLNNTLRRLQRDDRPASASPDAAPQCVRLMRGPCFDNECAVDEAPRAGIKRRRPSDEAAAIVSGGGEYDLYLPPTPRMISSLEEEDEACKSADSQCAKKQKSGGVPSGAGPAANDSARSSRPALRPCNSLPCAPPPPPSSLTSQASNQNSSPVSGYAATCLTSGGLSGLVGAAAAQYSCGQSSLFGELQSVVFHSLITSLES